MPRCRGASLLVVLARALAVCGRAEQVLGLAVSVWQAGPGALSTVSATFPAASIVITSLGMADQRSATTWIVPSDCRWTWTW